MFVSPQPVASPVHDRAEDTPSVEPPRPPANALIVEQFINGRRSELDVLKVTASNIHRCGGNVGQAQRCVQELKRAVRPGTRERVLPNAYVHNALISAYAKAADPAGAREALRRMLDQGLAPDVTTSNELMSAYRKARDAKGARRAFRDMRGLGVVPDVDAWNALIRACLDANDFRRASRYFQRMRRRRTPAPDYLTYHVMISSLASRGMHDQAEALLDQAVEDGVLRANLGLNEERNELDLHRQAVEVHPRSREHGLCGISASLAQTIFRRLLSRRQINRLTHVIVGSHGPGRLRDAIRECMMDCGWAAQHPRQGDGELNRGRWVGSEWGARAPAD